MDNKEKDYLGHDDYCCIGHEIINLLHTHGCTHLDAEKVFRYASAQLREQKVQQYKD